MQCLQTILNKLDYKISQNFYSRPQFQVILICRKLKQILKRKASVLLDIGGGSPPQYKDLLEKLTKKYINLEIKNGLDVDIVGSIYDIPLKKSYAEVVVLFMVMEHLNDPDKALHECHRVLKENGHIALTTVQYWHTHNHPNDYFRYTKSGLEYLLNKNNFKVIDIWSIGGPFLVVFHAIELNLYGIWRTIFSIVFYNIFNWLDLIVFRHSDHRLYSDSVGWSVIARKI